MLMQALKYAAAELLAVVLLFCSCTGAKTEHTVTTFAVLDVGEGLAQIVCEGDSAVCIDVGPSSGAAGWLDGWEKIGAPKITTIILSHGHEDHIGNIGLLDKTVTGRISIVISPFQDSVEICDSMPAHKGRLSFRRISAGDSLQIFSGVTARCLWPPYGFDTAGKDENAFSLCLKITDVTTSYLITGDIDSTSMNCIADSLHEQLCSDVAVVPHHGSSGSFSTLFWGYARPEYCAVSCGIGNSYGFPALSIMEFLSQTIGCAIFDTRNGSVVFGDGSGIVDAAQ